MNDMRHAALNVIDIWQFLWKIKTLTKSKFNENAC